MHSTTGQTSGHVLARPKGVHPPDRRQTMCPFSGCPELEREGVKVHQKGVKSC